MHYCAVPVTEQVANVIAVADDATTCAAAAVGAVDLQIPAVLVPAISFEQGALLAGAVFAVWAVGAVVAFAVQSMRSIYPSERD